MSGTTQEPSPESIYTAGDIAQVFEEIAPRELGNPKDNLGFLYGSTDTVVTGIGCLWSIDRRSLVAAIREGVNMLITHEGLFFKPQTSAWYDGPDEDGIHWNKLRRHVLDEHGMVVYRSHSNWDALPEDGVVDQGISALGMSGLEVVGAQKYFRVHQLPEPMTVEALKNIVAQGLGFLDCRIFGNRQKEIRRFSFLVGGFGGNQYHMPQAAAELGAEAIIIGAMDEFIVMNALELGMPVIETLHSVSEIPAIKRQAEILAESLPGLKVVYLPSGAIPYNEPKDVRGS